MGIQEQLAALRAENDALKAKVSKQQQLRFKVSEKGAVSVYGIHARFPITVYKDQWKRIAAAMPDILLFIEENDAYLAKKD